MIIEMTKPEEMTEPEVALSSSEPPYRPKKEPSRRNLGSAILLAAVQDYLSLDDEVHDHAAVFLYPRTAEWRRHYEWAVAMAEGIDPAWLRDGLDRHRGKWDRSRREQMRRKNRPMPEKEVSPCTLSVEAASPSS